MTSEKKDWMLQVSNILIKITEKYPYSEACVNCDQDESLFLDTCNFVGMHTELINLAACIKDTVKYSEWAHGQE